MKMASKWILVSAVVSLAAFLCMTVGLPVVQGSAEHVRWDIISQTFVPPLTTSAGGIASAHANDNSTITLTGSGTFVAPGGSGDGTNSAVTGGGTWKTCNPAGTVCVNGTYEVTGLVRWEPAPFPPGGGPARIDLIDDGVPSTGLVVLRIEYSDGKRGILVVSCTGATAPPSMFEGITASKGFVDYWNRVAPVGGVDGNRTVFHIE